MRIEHHERLPEDVQRWLAGAGAVLLIACGVAFLHACGVQVCVFRRVTGYPCLTCGSTRAAAALVSGHFAEAVRTQPLAVAAGMAAALALAVYAWLFIVRRRVFRVRLSSQEWKWLGAAALLLAVLNWVYLLRHGL